MINLKLEYQIGDQAETVLIQLLAGEAFLAGAIEKIRRKKMAPNLAFEFEFAEDQQQVFFPRFASELIDQQLPPYDTVIFKLI